MLKSKNIFVCIGAIHHDYLLNLKKNIINFRSNQITQKSRIGGVAYNIAELLSNFVDVNFHSLAINEKIRKKRMFIRRSSNARRSHTPNRRTYDMRSWGCGGMANSRFTQTL